MCAVLLSYTAALAVTQIGSFSVPANCVPGNIVGKNGILYVGLGSDQYSLGAYSPSLGWMWTSHTFTDSTGVYPPTSLIAATTQSTLYAAEYQTKKVALISAVSGVTLDSVTFDSAPLFLAEATLPGAPPILIVVTPKEVAYYSCSTANLTLLRTMPFPTGELVGQPYYDSGMAKLFIPLSVSSQLMAQTLVWSQGNLLIVMTTAPSETGARICSSGPGTPYVAVLGANSSTTLHNKITLAGYVGVPTPYNAVDAVYQGSTLVAISAFASANPLDDYVAGYVAGFFPVMVPHRYFVSICRTNVPGFVFFIDRGVRPVDDIGAGALCSIDLASGQMVAAVPLAGGNAASWYNPSNSHLYVSEARMGAVKEFQLP